MGTYATTTSLYTFLVGTSSDSATTALLTSCITWAEDEVNKHLSKRYDVSAFLTTTGSVPPLVRSITEQLTVGFFHQNNWRGSKEQMQRAELLLKRPMENLQALADGKMALVDSSGAKITPNISPSAMCNTSDYTPVFGMDDPLKWKVDSDLKSDIASERD